MIKPPQITTIIPTYRRPHLLGRSIQSVLNQTYPHFQVCIYDNASDDETATVVANFSQKDSRVKYHCHPENIGAVANFNYGMARVDTPYFSFLSDDDIVLPEFYKTTLAGFAEYPDAIFSAGEVIGMTEEGEVGGTSLHSWNRIGYFSPPEGLFEMLNKPIHLPGLPATLFRRELIEQFGLFDPDIALNDMDLYIRVAARFPFVISRQPCSVYTAQASSISVVNQWDFIYQEYPKVVSKMKNDLPIPVETRERAAAILLEQYKDVTFRAGVSAVVVKNFSEAHKIAKFLDSHYHQANKARLIDALAKIGSHASPIHWLLVSIYKFRKIRAKRKVGPLQAKYGELVRYLKIK